MSTRNDGEKYGPGLIDALNAVADERVRQDAKWGEQNHHPFTYLAILGEEVGEANQAALQATFGGKTWADYRTELVHVAAVAVAMIECLDRKRAAPEPAMLPQSLFDPKHGRDDTERQVLLRDCANLCPRCAAGQAPELRRRKFYHCTDREQDLWEPRNASALHLDWVAKALRGFPNG